MSFRHIISFIRNIKICCCVFLMRLSLMASKNQSDSEGFCGPIVVVLTESSLGIVHVFYFYLGWLVQKRLEKKKSISTTLVMCPRLTHRSHVTRSRPLKGDVIRAIEITLNNSEFVYLQRSKISKRLRWPSWSKAPD